MKGRKVITIICIELLILSSAAQAYDNQNVHPEINKKAIFQSSVALVLDLLGFSEGLDTKFSYNSEEKKVFEWIEKGGTDEDNIPWFLNHFHDPLQEWDEAGLDIPIIPQSDSSLTYAQLQLAPYSWQKARTAYFNALRTGSEEEYAALFLTMGHLMHLVSDSAVPAHVRNDPHPIDPDDPLLSAIPQLLWPESWLSDPYEEWANENFDQINFTGVPVDGAIFSNFVQSGAGYQLSPIPVTALWDQDRYTLENPDPEMTKDPDSQFHNIGLAEYTNANFFSINTMLFTQEYPHPTREDVTTDIDWLNPEMHVAEDGKTDYRPYLWGNAGGASPIRLAAGSLISYNCMAINHSGVLVLDDTVHKDYASVLVPRAVGYSAALLDYFFRGTLNVGNALPQPGVPITQADGKIQWMTPMWDISAEVGNVSTLGTDEDGNSIPEPVGLGSLIGVARYTSGDTVLYAVSEPVVVDAALAEGLNSEVPQPILFHFSTGIPAGAADLSLQVVFQGALGNEADTAVAAGRCPIPAGSLAITFPDEFVYAIVDGSVSPHQFTQVKTRIRNTTTMIDADGLTVPVEMSGGSLHAVAVYKIIPGLLEDLSNFPPDSASLMSLMAGESFSASVSAPIPIDTLSSQQYETYTFDFTDEPIPAGVTDLYLTVYYEGAAQTDQSSFTCLGGKDLNEPQQITYWNDTDYFLLYGAAVKADDIRDDPDVDLYGYIDPHRISKLLGFSAAYTFVNPPAVASIALLDGARYSKLIILTENVAQYYVTDRLVCHTPDGASWFDATYRYALPGFVNQMRLDYTWQWTPLYTIREVTQHQRVYYMNFYPYFSYINTLPAPPENALGPFPVTIDFP